MDVKERIIETAVFKIQKLQRKDGFLLGFDVERLVLAFAKIESGLNPYAVRFEPKWTYLENPDKFSILLGITKETEETFQSCSWGLFQIMGAVARELGYDDFLHLLATEKTIRIQTELFVRHLHRLYVYYLKRYGSEELANKLAIAGYNAGFGLKDYNTQYFKKIIEVYKNE